jgi:hypothetical protein
VGERIRLSRAKGWRLPENAVNVARPGPWGNPFVVGKDGDRARCVELFELALAGYLCVSTSHATIDAQRALFRHVHKHLGQLRGKDLACWCRLDGKPCHADVLLRLANA